MNIRRIGVRSLVACCGLLASCVSKVDLCTLVTAQEVMALNSTTATCTTEDRAPLKNDPSARAKFGIWKDANGTDGFAVANDVAPKQALVRHLRRLVGTAARVEHVPGVGSDAAVAFDSDHMILFEAHDGTFLVQVLAPQVADQASRDFAVAIDLVGKALGRMH